MRLAVVLLLTASVAFGQAASKPAATPANKLAKAPVAAAKSPATTTKVPATTAKAPAAVKPVPDMPAVRTLPKPLFAERYIDIKVGTGALAEPNKMYSVQYSGYFADTGKKFDSSYDHRMPVVKDGKPVLDADSKPVLGDAQPLTFPQGMGRLIPGFDRGLEGMHVGGKRRIFIPYQLAYGELGRPGPDATHAGIPPKADLVFDVELVSVADMPQQPGPQAPPVRPATPPAPPKPATQPTPPAPPQPK